MLKRNLSIIALVLICTSTLLLAHGEERTGVLVDVRCAESLLKALTQLPDHAVACSLENKESGFGIIAKGKFYKLDDYGNQQALLLLETTPKTENLIVRVEGHFENGIAKVGAMEAVEKIPAT